MTKLVEKTKAVRKTFTIPNYIADELEEYATDYDIKQSQIVADAIEQYIEKQTQSKKIQKRLDALKNLTGIVPEGSLADIDKDELRALKAEKYAL